MYDDVSTELRTWGLSEEVVATYCSNNVGKILVRLAREGFQCSESDPLLLLCHNVDDLENSKVYLHGGNYALPAGVPGHVKWPGNGHEPHLGDQLPPGVDAVPPFALGRFIVNNFTQAIDKTQGTDLSVLHMPDFETFCRIDVAVRRSPQFRRISAAIAQVFGLQAFVDQPPLVRAFLLDRLNGRPNFVGGFTLV
ncbi:hypothetical protein AC1031_002380 [Aphanomyces cochlioides]|nr:hypothetical protein AC1031_002380 [Aphanomyces cochlioides]